jgi:hypothetical protein
LGFRSLFSGCWLLWYWCRLLRYRWLKQIRLLAGNKTTHGEGADLLGLHRVNKSGHRSRDLKLSCRSRNLFLRFWRAATLKQIWDLRDVSTVSKRYDEGVVDFFKARSQIAKTYFYLHWFAGRTNNRLIGSKNGAFLATCNTSPRCYFSILLL